MQSSGEMKPVLVRAGWLAVMALFLLAVAPVQAQEGQSSAAAEIVRRAVAHVKRANELEVKIWYAFRQDIVTEKLDGKGNIKSRELRVYEVVPIEGLHYWRLVERDGKALAAEELKKEQEREKKFRAEVTEVKRRRAQNQERVLFNEELIGRYQWTLAGEEVVNDRPAFVLSFEPKAKNLPAKRWIDQLLNKLTGKLWVDKQEYEPVNVEAGLLEKVTMWGGLVASVEEFSLSMEQIRVDEGVWMPHRLSQYLKGRFLFRSVHQRSQRQTSEFKKLAAQGVRTQTQP